MGASVAAVLAPLHGISLDYLTQSSSGLEQERLIFTCTVRPRLRPEEVWFHPLNRPGQEERITDSTEDVLHKAPKMLKIAPELFVVEAVPDTAPRGTQRHQIEDGSAHAKTENDSASADE